jgi:hypothetical protein
LIYLQILRNLRKRALVQWLPLFRLGLFEFLACWEVCLFSERLIVFDLLNCSILLRIFIKKAALICCLIFRTRLSKIMVVILLWVTSLFLWSYLVTKLKLTVFISPMWRGWWRQIFYPDLVDFRLFTLRTSFSKWLRFMRLIITVIINNLRGYLLVLLDYSWRFFSHFLREIWRGCIASILGGSVLLYNGGRLSKISSATTQCILLYNLLMFFLKSFNYISKLVASTTRLISPVTSDTANSTLTHKWCYRLLSFKDIVGSLLNPTRLSL